MCTTTTATTINPPHLFPHFITITCAIAPLPIDDSSVLSSTTIDAMATKFIHRWYFNRNARNRRSLCTTNTNSSRHKLFRVASPTTTDIIKAVPTRETFGA